MIGTWTTTRQDDAANAYRLTTPRGRLDGDGEYGRRWAAPRRWREGRAAAHSPHPSAASAGISVSVRRRNWSRRARVGRAADPQAKPVFSRRPRPITKRHLSALTVPSLPAPRRGSTGGRRREAATTWRLGEFYVLAFGWLSFLAARVYVPLTGSLRVRFFRDPPRDGCNSFKVLHSVVWMRLREKKERSDRQEYKSL